MTLKIGDRAPEFTLPTNEGDVSLKDFKGHPVVVYFYPKDDTPGCTKEACHFRDNMNVLKRAGATVIGISKDTLKSHDKFTRKFELNFPLASDENLETIQAYGSWVEKSMYGKKYMGIARNTFLIDGEGRIADIWHDVKVDGHVDAVIMAVKALDKSQAA